MEGGITTLKPQFGSVVETYFQMNALLCADCPLPLPLEVSGNHFQYTLKNPVPDTLGHSSSMIYGISIAKSQCKMFDEDLENAL